MARDRIGNRATKTVLLQRQRGEPVDATVPLGPAFAQRDIEAIDRAGPARQRTVLERLLAQAAVRFAQRPRVRGQAGTQCRSCRVAADEQRCHRVQRSKENTSELQSLMRISYAVFCVKKNT